MYKYLLKTNNTEHIFYYKPYEGIVIRSRTNSVWKREKLITTDSLGNFFAYTDENDIIHLLLIDKDNKLIYMSHKDNEWQKYTVGNINAEFEVKKLMVGKSNLGYHLFYSALYRDEYILVHCILGDNAMPETIGKLHDESFFVFENKVYFSNQESSLGYMNFNDGKPVNFVKLFTGIMPYVVRCGNEERVIYVNEMGIYVNDERYAEDKNAEYPIIVQGNNSYNLMWKNNDFIRYVPFDSEQKGKKSMQYVSSGIKPDTYVYSNGAASKYYYGIMSDNCLKFFANAKPFNECEESEGNMNFIKKDMEINQLKNNILSLKQEIDTYKKELLKLNMMLSMLDKASKEVIPPSKEA